jgi:diguanylate cyclase (GGDEF)-like protein/PAS domain S-box-containing protein
MTRDALPTAPLEALQDIRQAVAMLDRRGNILAASTSWDVFLRDYLDVSCVSRAFVGLCQTMLGDRWDASVATQFDAVLTGQQPTLTIDCARPSRASVVWLRFTIRSTDQDVDPVASVVAEAFYAPAAHTGTLSELHRLAALLRYATDLVGIIDASGLVRYQSPSLEPVLGHRCDQLIGHSAFSLTHPDDTARVQDVLATLVRIPNASADLDVRVRHRDGSWRLLACTFTNLTHDPDITGVVVNSRDVTEQRATSERLVEQVESFASLFHETTEGRVVVHGLTIVRANPALASLVGRPTTDIAGSDLSSLFAPSSEATARHHLEAGDGTWCEVVARRSDGLDVPIEIMVRPLFFEGVPSQLLTARDISDRKAGEQQLRSSEARFRALIQEGSDLIVVFDREGRITYANPALERMLGYPTTEHADVLRIDLVHPEDQSMMSRDWIALLETPGKRIESRYRMQRASGEWMWLEGILTNLMHDPAVGGIVLNARDVSERWLLEMQLHDLALHDPLTTLPNRTLLIDRLDQALQFASQHPGHDKVAVLHLDVNDFSSIRNGLGHTIGEAVVQLLAHRLLACVQVPQTVARLSGDEFAVLLPGVTSTDDIQTVLVRLRQAMADPVLIQGHTIPVGISIGVAVQRNRQTTADELLRQAGDALHEAKRQGHERTVFYADGMTEEAVRRYTLRSDLRHAAEHEELSLRYQPIVDLKSEQVVQYEALLRWQHPRYGAIPPVEFIPFAEADGSVVDIGQWVIRQVCRQLATWTSSSAVVAINLSGRQFGSTQIVNMIRDECAAAAVSPSQLAVEVTEYTLIENHVAAKTVIRELRQLGLGVSIDDFGTGFSSLRYLRDLPVTAVKLDQSFVQQLGEDPAAAAIVKAMIEMAHALGLTVTAEGIETATQLTWLQRLGCDHGQGYLLAHPALPQEMAGSMTVLG